MLNTTFKSLKFSYSYAYAKQNNYFLILFAVQETVPITINSVSTHISRAVFAKRKIFVLGHFSLMYHLGLPLL
jgi:hypothetical protein